MVRASRRLRNNRSGGVSEGDAYQGRSILISRPLPPCCPLAGPSNNSLLREGSSTLSASRRSFLFRSYYCPSPFFFVLCFFLLPLFQLNATWARKGGILERIFHRLKVRSNVKYWVSKVTPAGILWTALWGEIKEKRTGDRHSSCGRHVSWALIRIEAHFAAERVTPYSRFKERAPMTSF